MRDRVFAGLLLALPFLITVWIVIWLYQVLALYLISPVARLVTRFAEGQSQDVPIPDWFTTWVAAPLGVLIVLAGLYALGWIAKTRVERLLDETMLRVPFITKIYRAVRGIFASLQGHGDVSRFQRAVLVAFPHPGMRVPGFVTGSCRDSGTGQTVLCIYVPTTPVPTSGYMLLVPEHEVTDLDWNLEETIQAVVSFGFTAPDHVSYYPVTRIASNAIDSASSASPNP